MVRDLINGHKRKSTDITCFLAILLLAGWFIPGCAGRKTDQTTFWLDSLEFNEITDIYGPPKRNRSFGRDTINIAGREFLRGLGTHAPSELNIDLDGKGKKFIAWIGVDREVTRRHTPEGRKSIGRMEFPNYVYDNRVDHNDPTLGSTVVFRVLLDGKTVYKSKLMTWEDQAEKIGISLNGASRLTLAAEPGDDGSYGDHCDWADARLVMKEESGNGLSIYRYPEGILVNHAGFLPGSFKNCYMHGTGERDFELVSEETGKTVFSGSMNPVSGDFGHYLMGDFTTYGEPGSYYLRSGNERSPVFRIGEDVYNDCLRKHLSFITAQRSGHPEKGWAPGNHLDDGIRQDNGRHQDVVGGWYDASDIRKSVAGDVLYLLTLSTLLETNDALDRVRLIDEIQWGNRFLLAMQEPGGYLMKYIGYTWEGYADNRWTDNIIGTEDDRTIMTDPARNSTQMLYVKAMAILIPQIRESHPEYARECREAAAKCYQWVNGNIAPEDPDDVATALSMHLEWYRLTGEKAPRDRAARLAEKLLYMQKTGGEKLSGYFYNIGKKGKVMSGHREVTALSEFAEILPGHELAVRCRQAVERFAERFYIPFTRTNVYRVVPWIIVRDTVLASGKRYGNFYYRNLLHVGVNRHLASNGRGLLYAARLTGKQELERIAQHQLDWIYGANPFNASSVTGIGYNQPPIFRTGPGEFSPPTPELTGGVMVGIGSDQRDNPNFCPGWWWTTEYWSPTVSYTIMTANMLVLAEKRKTD